MKFWISIWIWISGLFRVRVGVKTSLVTDTENETVLTGTIKTWQYRSQRGYGTVLSLDSTVACAYFIWNSSLELLHISVSEKHVKSQILVCKILQYTTVPDAMEVTNRLHYYFDIGNPMAKIVLLLLDSQMWPQLVSCPVARWVTSSLTTFLFATYWHSACSALETFWWWCSFFIHNDNNNKVEAMVTPRRKYRRPAMVTPKSYPYP